MIAHEVEKGFLADKVSAAEYGVTVSSRLILHDEPHARAQSTAGLGIPRLVAGTHHDAELIDAGAGRLLEHDLKGGLRLARRINERLQRQRALPWVCRGDQDFSHSHRAGIRTPNVNTAGRGVESETLSSEL